MRVALWYVMLVVVIVIATAVTGWLWAIMMWHVGGVMLRSRSVVRSCIRHYKRSAPKITSSLG